MTHPIWYFDVLVKACISMKLQSEYFDWSCIHLLGNQALFVQLFVNFFLLILWLKKYKLNRCFYAWSDKQETQMSAVFYFDFNCSIHVDWNGTSIHWVRTLFPLCGSVSPGTQRGNHHKTRSYSVLHQCYIKQWFFSRWTVSSSVKKISNGTFLRPTNSTTITRISNLTFTFYVRRVNVA